MMAETKAETEPRENDMNILKNIASLTNIPQILKIGEVVKLVKDEIKRKRPSSK